MSAFLRSSAIRSFSTTAKKHELFDKILIANRGEIACRVIKTCRKLGIKTVAIYSEPDANSLHVKMADEAVCVGPAQSTYSYLNIPNILAAIKQTGAQAVHPGYGFLSENKIFQETLQKNGVKFIGPNTHAIEAMGDKIASKKIAQDAKVNVIPGHLGRVEEDQVVEIARKIGYPVMVKASAGGGGKGMRVAYNDEEALEGFRLSTAEAKSSFGDDTIFVEKFIEEPRHIEFQLIGDEHGNVIYLNERECSVQRRNQKVIEEAPSVFLDPATRKAMGEQAVRLAKAVGYYSAGTCEFLVDKHRNFFFLEMNTRLQVEHPVTECITGVDLVELMIRSAAGQQLPMTQEQVPICGWAMESRVYAEDPLRGFLPSIGTLTKYKEPAGKQIRVDSGIEEGAEISMFYDPMISKLITYGKDRNEALQKMREALDSYVIRGVTHNINFLRDLCDNPRWIDGRLSTKFIAEEYPKGFHGAKLSQQDQQALVAAAVSLHSRKLQNQLTLSGQLESFNREAHLRQGLSSLVVSSSGNRHVVSVESFAKQADGSSKLTFTLDGQKVDVVSDYQGQDVFRVTYGGKEYTMQVVAVSDGSPKINIQLAGTNFELEVRTAREESLLKYMPVKEVIDTSKMILSPMPGAVYSVKVQVGDAVVPGQEVCVVEAMKMQNALRAVNPGKVKKVHVKPGQTVAADQVLVELE